MATTGNMFSSVINNIDRQFEFDNISVPMLISWFESHCSYYKHQTCTGSEPEGRTCLSLLEMAKV